MKTILMNCRLIPQLSNSFSQEYANVVLMDDKISEVLPNRHQVAHEPTDRIIDCQGKTLLPGLFDLHTHMNWAYHNGEIRLDDFKIMTEAMQSARLFLENGFTTIRDLGSPRRVAAAVRTAIQAGVCIGPRMFCGGLILSPVNRPIEPDPYNFLRFVSGCDHMTRCVREEIGGGSDYVKLYTPMLPEEMQTAVRVASFYHKPVAVHAHDLRSIRLCIECGVNTIEHGSYIDAACIDALKQKSIYLVPTLSALSPEIATPGFTPDQKARILRPLMEANEKNITAAYQSGLCLGFGTDAPIEELDRHPGIEFRMRKEHCGMENVDILLQATKNSAKILGLENVTGEIRAGLSADLILVDGNPDQDLTVMEKKPELVFTQGVLCEKRSV